jgi:hypothetical protein
MTPDLAETVVPAFLTAMRERLQEALACARAAEAYVPEGGIDGAVRIALDIEPLVHEVNTLLNAASLVNRMAGS